MEENQKSMSIEAGLARLDELIVRLEGEELSMEESFAAYAEGLSLIKTCRDSIDEIEKKVLVLEESGEINEF